jgi:YidC/Oxa1 family membrane protein insertase
MNNILPNSPRVYLWVALLLLLLFNYQTWMRDYAPAPVPATAATPAAPAPANELGSRAPEAGAPSVAPQAAAPAAASAIPAESGMAAEAPAGVVHVRTDVLDLDISLRGGTLTRVDLPAYPQVKGESTPVRLENEDSPATRYELQSGLTGSAQGVAYADQRATFASARSDYTLGSAGELTVPLTWSEGGVTVTKTFTFRRGQYAIGLNYQVHNAGESVYDARPYTAILRNDPRTKSSYFHVESYAFHGPALYDGSKYRTLDPTSSTDGHVDLQVTDGWIAALQHHFVSAVVPPRGAPWNITLRVEGERYLLTAMGPQMQVEPGATVDFTQTLFAGPKLQKQLEAISPDLGRVVDYGKYLYVLARPLFLLLEAVHRFTGNWGIAIILVTFLLKLAFYPLSEASGRSMAKMKVLQPRIKALQDTYKDDKEKLGRAMMELYQREKANPVAGCLPIIIQIPVFIAFYWVLLESVEMRQAPFGGWIHDLSARDPLFILPLIMAAAMFVQYRLNPTPPDPVQAKVFMIMPLVMSVMFAFFPAGLVLYWVTNTILSIAQQWNINRRIEREAAARRT